MAKVAQIPTSFGHELRACLRCRLVKTYDQFRESGCENCPFFNMDNDHEHVVDCTTPNFTGMIMSMLLIALHPILLENDHEHVVDCTTPNFTGIISVMDPSRSWAARWLRIGKFVPGCYTLAVSEALPDEYQGICEDNHIQYVQPKRV